MSIWSALAEAQKVMEQPVLDGTGHAGKNGSRTYKYATLASVRKAVFPPCNERGIFITQHFDGENLLITEAHMGEEAVVLDKRMVALVGRPQEDGSAETYAKRYALCSVFGLAGIEDDDGEGAQNAPQGQQRRPQKQQPKPQAKPQPQTPEEAAKQRLWAAIKGYCQRNGTDPNAELEELGGKEFMATKPLEWFEAKCEFFEAN